MLQNCFQYNQKYLKLIILESLMLRNIKPAYLYDFLLHQMYYGVSKVIRLMYIKKPDALEQYYNGIGRNQTDHRSLLLECSRNLSCNKNGVI